ncbi:MAG: pyruvate kinase, partial [Bacteroidota bacterium]
TIGPASEGAGVVKKLIQSGVDIFRLNLKHNTLDSHAQNIDVIKKEAKKLGMRVDILLDLPQPSFSLANKLILETKPEYIALSHVKKEAEVVEFKNFCKENKLSTNLVAKIETNESLKQFDKILDKTDSLMIARGDLGRTIPIEQVPFVQKEIVLACNKSKKMVIVATEMLLSMISNKQPTRAEASDVANAVLEGGDAVMLSEETAIGENPVEAVKIMDKILVEAESWKKLGHLHIYSVKKKKFKFGG